MMVVRRMAQVLLPMAWAKTLIIINMYTASCTSYGVSIIAFGAGQRKPEIIMLYCARPEQLYPLWLEYNCLWRRLEKT